MTFFALVGLAGSGKSSVTKHLARAYDKPVVSTDKEFASICADITHPVSQTYLNSFAEKFKQPYDVSLLSSTAAMINTYGNDTFRDFEESAIIWMFQNGKMDNAVPDLGGAAFMRSGTRNALKEAGIVSVYIKAPADFIADNLFKDYEDSKKSGTTTRGNYFDYGAKAERENKSVRDALKEMSQSHLVIRKEFYEMADMTILIESENTIEEVAEKVKTAVIHFNSNTTLKV